jgi:hypothetical protein
MVYGPIQAGLYGACERIYPVHTGDKPCDNCGENGRAPGDWLCERCRREHDQDVREYLAEEGLGSNDQTDPKEP